jgi:hypothetical protein
MCAAQPGEPDAGKGERADHDVAKLGFPGWLEATLLAVHADHRTLPGSAGIIAACDTQSGKAFT